MENKRHTASREECSTLLLDKFYSSEETEEIIKMFTKAQNASLHPELHGSVKLFISAAENYESLLTELCAEVKSIYRKRLERPLYSAMRTGDLKVVATFLRAGASLGMRSSFVTITENAEVPGDEYVLPIEFACVLDKPEMLSLFVSYFNDHNPERDCRSRSALHIITSLGTKYWERSITGELNSGQLDRHFALEQFVQIIIDAGEDVNCRDQGNYTALSRFLNKVNWMICVKHWVLDSKILRSIAETVRILLQAGSDSTDDCYTLLRINLIVCKSNIYYRRGVVQTVNKFPIFLDAFHSLLKRETTQINVRRMLNETLEVALLLAKRHYPLLWQKFNDNVDFEGELNNLWDGLADLYRVLVLARGDWNNIYYRARFSEMTDTGCFCSIWSCASEDGGSVSFVRLILSRMTASEINALKESIRNAEFAAKARNAHGPLYDIHEFGRKLLFDIEMPFSLQHLARAVITEAKPAVYEALIHKLPKQLQSYVQFK